MARDVLGAGDVVLEHIVEKAHDIGDELIIRVPVIPFFEIERA